MERKYLEKKLKIFVYLLGFFFILLVFRLGYMQVWEADRYRTLATQNHQRLIPMEAPRGEILDSNGIRIVSNKPVYTVSLIYLGIKDNEDVISRLASLLAQEESYKGMAVEQIREDIRGKLKEHQRLYEPVKLATGVSQGTVNRIEELRLELPGVSIDVEPVRYYPYKDLMGEVLGYVREITAEELEKFSLEEQSQEYTAESPHYAMGDMIGKVGIEKTYEDYLRGKKGARLVEVDAQARPVRDLGIKEPVPGNNLVLTVDYRLQRAAQDAVVSGLARAKQLGYAKPPKGKVPSGAAVVMDVRTGKVLAMASIPSYDLNIFSGTLTGTKYNDLISSGALRNHAIQSIYTPGSTFKMASASAFLEKNIVNLSTVINDPGYYKYKNDWKPGGHGKVTMIKALKYSCDTFFYMFGAKTGPEAMSHYAGEYGLGQLTGIDLPGEEKGYVATPEVKKEHWSTYSDPRVREWESQWHEYDSMDMAIGQQENKFTAIQLANYVASIANGGILYQPYVVDKALSPDGRVLMENKPRETRRVNVSAKTLEILREGMHEVAITDGTASSIFTGAKYSAAAKTGTAEVGNGNNHALFVAFAPYENPEIAVSVIIEYGGKGSGIAGPVARQILDAYFNLKKLPKPDAYGQEQNGGETPETGDSGAAAGGSAGGTAGRVGQPGTVSGQGSVPARQNQSGGGGNASVPQGGAGQGNAPPDGGTGTGTETPATTGGSGQEGGVPPPAGTGGGILPPDNGGNNAGTGTNSGGSPPEGNNEPSGDGQTDRQ
ncbi:penicillin-binding protein 2 [Desulfocucumis palustris]|uniref:Penicillin-binding protein 2 n=1 Tax=Desulfocucumis palustris TaxID=1898651 RepID=A0A2L2XFF3_9FIRM|nr:penicillin-binding protein 2 [Desulfocucumis palustris]GBF34890.1 penicillin-binding protein 2 [Desulfocucumis palustris]